ncbi:hypothetical protein [Amycolatopsis sp. NBC_00438]|uniref:hypothetical protein n=1 Tax=Amycolatopsis sp. NBC_00438 TaxID=2903558 RepID=UPI002E241C9F
MAMAGNPIWRSRYVRDALDLALPRLDGEGAREDRGYAIYALHRDGRHDEAVAQFRRPRAELRHRRQAIREPRQAVRRLAETRPETREGPLDD